MSNILRSAHIRSMATTQLPRELRKLDKIASAQGWELGRTSKGHVKFTGPAGHTIFYSGTPSDHRSHLNMLAKLRRAGLDIPRSFKS